MTRPAVHAPDFLTLAPEALGPTLTIGEILVEIMATTPGEGFLEPQPLIGPFPSGAPAIFIDQCARFGGGAALIGAVGADDFGRMVLDRLRRDGVDVSAVAVSDKAPTGSAFVRYRPDGGRDFVFNLARSAASALRWTRTVAAQVARAGHLHVMGSALAMPQAGALIERAWPVIRARGGTLSVDPNLRKELAQAGPAADRLARLVAEADLVLPSGGELLDLAGARGEAEALRTLFGRGAKAVVLKRGAAGASAVSKDGTRVEAPVFAVEERDPTGAGDAFGGALVACRRQGLPLDQALAYAAAAGARTVTRLGPMEGTASRADLDAFIAGTLRRG